MRGTLSVVKAATRLSVGATPNWAEADRKGNPKTNKATYGIHTLRIIRPIYTAIRRQH